MGAFISKKQKKIGRKEGTNEGGTNAKVNSVEFPPGTSANNLRVISKSIYDDEQINILKRELKETPQIFVLNNLLLSIMFFENYEKDKQKLFHSNATAMEKELNPILRRDETIECIIPDVIFDKVYKNIRYRPVHGPNKFKSESLVAKRIFVVSDNIEVLESKNSSAQHYSAIDKPSYQAVMQDSDHEGFVKLKYIENLNKSRTASPQTPSTPQSPRSPQEAKPGSSSSAPEEEIYAYSTITDVNTPKPLEIETYERRDTLPKTCFTNRKVRKFEEEGSSSSSSSSDDSDDEEPTDVQDLYETISYVSSSGFMRYFQNAIFPHSLGFALGFDRTEISLANAIPGKIFCNLMDEDTNMLPCEVIPSVSLQWPHHQAYEFSTRAERPELVDRFDNRYKWPTNQMVMEVKTLNCVLIPKGCFHKRGENLDSDIEWDIAFPRAERYLDIRMTHAQMKSFLTLLTLFKTYIEPTTQQHGLLVEHIRYHMYWECESNPKDWPEHRLGTKLVKVITSLNDRLSKGHLPDFFIKKKNVFGNIPQKFLKHAQRVFHEILESPAIYFIGALRNLRYTSAKFYPALDFKKLHKILTEEGIKMVNATLTDDSIVPPNFKNKKRPKQVQGDANFKKELKWRYKKEQMYRERALQKLKLEQEKQEENLIIKRTGSVDSIDFDWECENEFDLFKTRQILIFFIEHFLEMAKKSRKLSTKRQSLLFLKQAYYLARILGDTPGFLDDAQQWLEKIAKEEETIEKSSSADVFEQVPPSTPKRNSTVFNWDMTQQVKDSNINLNNLNKEFNNPGPSSSSGSYTKGIKKQHPGNLKLHRMSSNVQEVVLRNAKKDAIAGEDRKSLEVTGRKSVGFSKEVEVRRS